MLINGKELCESCFRELEEGSVCENCRRKAKKIKGALPVGMVLFDRFTVGRATDSDASSIAYYGYDGAQDRRVLVREFIPEELAERAEDGISVKVLDEDGFGAGLERFFAEARALSNFKKCNGVVKIYKFFNENGTSYYVTELLDGYDLEKYLNKLSRSIPETAAVKIIIKTAEALEDVHASESCHGQLSPKNVFLCSNGTVKLSDVGGISSMPGEYALRYAPIERRIRNYGRACTATDVYSLGVILYEMITGKTVPDPILRLDEDGLDLEGISDQLRPAVRTMLEIIPKNRYQSLGELKSALAGRLTIKATPHIEPEQPRDTEEAPEGETVTFTPVGQTAERTAVSGMMAGRRTGVFDRAGGRIRKNPPTPPDDPEAPVDIEFDEVESIPSDQNTGNEQIPEYRETNEKDEYVSSEEENAEEYEEETRKERIRKPKKSREQGEKTPKSKKTLLGILYALLVALAVFLILIVYIYFTR